MAALHQSVYLLCTTPSRSDDAQRRMALDLAARCANGCWQQDTTEDPAADNASRASRTELGSVTVLYTDSSIMAKTQLIVGLAEQIEHAKATHAQLQPESNAQTARLQNTALDACLSAVASADAIHAWKSKCRVAFGAGFQTSMCELGQMGTCEARQAASGKQSTVAGELLKLFSETL